MNVVPHYNYDRILHNKKNIKKYAKRQDIGQTSRYYIGLHSY